MVAAICCGESNKLLTYSSYVLIVLMLHQDIANVTSGHYNLLEQQLCSIMPAKGMIPCTLHLSKHSSLFLKHFCYPPTSSYTCSLTLQVSVLYVTLALSTV